MVENINNVKIKNCICDELHIREATSSIDLSSMKKDWQIDTFLLAKFQNDLEAGNVGLGGLVVDNWKIRRRRLDSTSFVNLGTQSTGVDGNFTYIDHQTRNGITYEYEVILMSGDIEGQPKTIQVACELEYYWISDENESYPLFVEFKPSQIQTNIQRNMYEGFDRFPKVSYGNLKYRSGSITAMLLDKSLETSFNYRNNFEDFINNQKTKYFKSRHGDFMIIDTFGSSQELLDIVPNKNISTITFNYTEVELPKEE